MSMWGGGRSFFRYVLLLMWFFYHNIGIIIVTSYYKYCLKNPKINILLRLKYKMQAVLF